jgi:thiol-disulfide isomerase/thioredoxin
MLRTLDVMKVNNMIIEIAPTNQSLRLSRCIPQSTTLRLMEWISTSSFVMHQINTQVQGAEVPSAELCFWAAPIKRSFNNLEDPDVVASNSKYANSPDRKHASKGRHFIFMLFSEWCSYCLAMFEDVSEWNGLSRKIPDGNHVGYFTLSAHQTDLRSRVWTL